MRMCTWGLHVHRTIANERIKVFKRKLMDLCNVSHFDGVGLKFCCTEDRVNIKLFQYSTFDVVILVTTEHVQ